MLEFEADGLEVGAATAESNVCKAFGIVREGFDNPQLCLAQ